MKTLIIEDHALFAEAFKYLLIETNYFDLIEIETDSNKALETVKSIKPDILFIDLNMPHKNGFDVIFELKKENIKLKIIVVSMVNDTSIIAKAFCQGVNAFIPKNTSFNELNNAIKVVLDHQRYLPLEFEKEVFTLEEKINAEKDFNFNSENETLSEREVEIIKLIAQGYTNVEISEKLFLSPLTIKTHRNNILKKLNINNTAALVKYAINLGII